MDDWPIYSAPDLDSSSCRHMALLEFINHAGLVQAADRQGEVGEGGGGDSDGLQVDGWLCLGQTLVAVTLFTVVWGEQERKKGRD